MRRGGRARRGNRWAATGAVLLVLVASSCRDVRTAVDVREDLSARVSVLVVPGPRGLGALGGKKELARIVAQLDNPDAGVRAKQVVEPGGMGILVTVEADSVEELSKPYALATPPAPAGASLQLFDSFTVARSAGTWRLDAVARPVDQVASGLPVLGGPLDDAQYEVNVELPGALEVSNGTEDEGGVSWDLYGVDTPTRLLMRTADSTPVSPLVIAVVASAVLVLVGLLFASRGKDAAKATKIRKESKRLLRSRRDADAGWQGAATGDPLPSGASASAAAAATAPAVLYADDHEGDDSLALPVPGAGWGPAPPEGSTTTGTVRPAPRPAAPSGEGAATMGPANPVVALDRGNRLGVSAEAAAAPTAPSVPPGWYADPEDPSCQRFWDGTGWTEHRS